MEQAGGAAGGELNSPEPRKERVTAATANRSGQALIDLQVIEIA